MDSFSFGEMLIQFFNVEEDLDEPLVRKGENENSLGIKVSVGSTSAFLAGDINNDDGDEDRLASVIGKVDLLKLAHHGLMGSSTFAFLNALQPSVAIVTGQQKNLYDETRVMLDKLATVSYATMNNQGVIVNFSESDFSLPSYQPIKEGFVEILGETYYTTLAGDRLRRWQFIDEQWYYFNASTGVMTRGWLNDGKAWYYLQANGVMKTGWLKDGQTWYYLKSNGAMATGWLKDGQTWYYLKSNGAMATGWLKDGQTWYYLKPSGAMATGWLQEGQSWYYLKPSGVMATGWLMVDGTWYYFEASGRMATNIIKDGWQITSSGAAYPL